MRKVEEIKADIASTKQNPTSFMSKGDCYYSTLQEIANLNNELCLALTVGISLDRLEKIAAAEHDGQCVVLPCKVGDTVYVIADWLDGITEAIVGNFTAAEYCTSVELRFSGRSWYFALEAFGTCVFLTRKEATAALTSTDKPES